jgi:hypothetical protein
VPNKFVENRRIRILSAADKTAVSFLSANLVIFDAQTKTGTTKFSIPRENFTVTPVGTQFAIDVILPTFRDGTGVNTVVWPTGNITVQSAEGDGTGSFTPEDQPVPQMFAYLQRRGEPQDIRILGNQIYQNGALTSRDGAGVPVQAQQRTDGDMGIDFITQDPLGSSTPAFPFYFGYGRTDQGPQTGPLPGNHGRGGIDDGSAGVGADLDVERHGRSRHDLAVRDGVLRAGGRVERDASDLGQRVDLGGLGGLEGGGIRVGRQRVLCGLAGGLDGGGRAGGGLGGGGVGGEEELSEGGHLGFRLGFGVWHGLGTWKPGAQSRESQSLPRRSPSSHENHRLSGDGGSGLRLSSQSM